MTEMDFALDTCGCLTYSSIDVHLSNKKSWLHYHSLVAFPKCCTVSIATTLFIDGLAGKVLSYLHTRILIAELTLLLVLFVVCMHLAYIHQSSSCCGFGPFVVVRSCRWDGFSDCPASVH